MTLRECTACREHLPLDMFSPHNRQGRAGLQRVCKPCSVIKNRQARARKAARDKGRDRRVCPSCRRTKDVTEPPGKCAGCVIANNLSRLTASLPSRAGRPGCLVYGATCKVLDEANERWVEMPVINCKTCGVDQHLPECLDCTAPIGQGDKQKSVRALRRCLGCSEWTPNVRCPGCVL